MTMIVTPVIIPVRSEPSWCEKNDCRCPCHSEPSRDWLSALALIALIVVPIGCFYLQYAHNWFEMDRPYSNGWDDRVMTAVLPALGGLLAVMLTVGAIAGLTWAVGTIYRSIFK